MLPCSMVLCGELEEEEGGKTALIDQRAIAAGKNDLSLHRVFKWSFEGVGLDKVTDVEVAKEKAELREDAAPCSCESHQDIGKAQTHLEVLVNRFLRQGIDEDCKEDEEVAEDWYLYKI